MRLGHGKGEEGSTLHLSKVIVAILFILGWMDTLLGHVHTVHPTIDPPILRLVLTKYVCWANMLVMK